MKGYRTIEEFIAYTDGLCDGANRMTSVILTSEQKILKSNRLEKQPKTECIAGRLGIFFRDEQWLWIANCIKLCTENKDLTNGIRVKELVDMYEYIYKKLKEREEL